jgi:GntR family transcriptional repressor for pyruvate dehydrogenase complex
MRPSRRSKYLTYLDDYTLLSQQNQPRPADREIVLAKRTSESDSSQGRRDSNQVGGKIRAPKVAELIATRIRGQIVRHHLEEGEALPPESELMVEFGVSRPTLREAFRILESESLITVARGSRGGARVHAPRAASVAPYVGLFLQYSGTTLEDVHAARIIIEPPAARMLARQKSSAACDQLRCLIEEGRGLESEPDQFAGFAMRFNELVMELSGNETLALFVRLLHDIVEKHSAAASSMPDVNKGFRQMIRSYKKLVRLVEAGDEDGAEEHWRRHVENIGQAMLKYAGRKTVIDLFD